MEVWAHTMVKNEERWLWYAVKSVVEYVDKILLWDTGSTDGTLKIIKSLKSEYQNKISFKEVGNVDKEGFTKVRQQMLDETKSDWFLMLDGDEIWYRDSILKVTNFIKNQKTVGSFESIVVPTINLVGDVYHYQEQKAGRYRFGDRTGHYNLRAVKRSIPGLHSQGMHGIWGWADADGNQIQDRNTFKIIENAKYIHASFLQRGGVKERDKEVIKRGIKRKFEIGLPFPLDFYYPEVFFSMPRPLNIAIPWQKMNFKFLMRAFFETPLRKFKRRIFTGPVGY